MFCPRVRRLPTLDASNRRLSTSANASTRAPRGLSLGLPWKASEELFKTLEIEVKGRAAEGGRIEAAVHGCELSMMPSSAQSPNTSILYQLSNLVPILRWPPRSWCCRPELVLSLSRDRSGEPAVKYLDDASSKAFANRSKIICPMDKMGEKRYRVTTRRDLGVRQPGESPVS